MSNLGKNHYLYAMYERAHTCFASFCSAVMQSPLQVMRQTLHKVILPALQKIKRQTRYKDIMPTLHKVVLPPHRPTLLSNNRLSSVPVSSQANRQANRLSNYRLSNVPVSSQANKQSNSQANRQSNRLSAILATVLLPALPFLLAGCTSAPPRLQNGDLVFVALPPQGNPQDNPQGNPQDNPQAKGSLTNPTQDPGSNTETLQTLDDAIAAATGKQGAPRITHVAILQVQADSLWIIDATPRHGVSRRSLAAFLTENRLADGTDPTYIIKRVTGAVKHKEGPINKKEPVKCKNGIDIQAAVERALACCGRSYDLYYQPGDPALYCSELVQACYLDTAGNPVFPSHPMNWLAADGSLPPYWEQLFAQAGMEVPQGLPGTNPQRMSEAECLQDVPGAILSLNP